MNKNINMNMKLQLKNIKLGNLKPSFLNALVAAICLHAALLAWLITSNTNSQPNFIAHRAERIAPAPAPKIVNAVAVNAKQVEQAVERLKQQKAAKARAERRREQAYKRKLARARRERIQEQQRLAKLQAKAKADAKKLAQKKAAAAKKLVKLKQQQRAEQKRLAKLKKQQAKQLAEQKARKAAQQKAEQLAKQAKQKAAAAAKAKALAEAKAKLARLAALQAEVDKFKALILQSIAQQWIVPEGTNPQLTCRLLIRLAPGGNVLSVKVARSSGDAVLDRSAVNAVYKASPLPVPVDDEAFDKMRLISLTVRPERVLSAA